MRNQTAISIYLDLRRAKDNGLYPVKLRVYSNNQGKAKLYATKFQYSEKEFHGIWNTTKPRTEHKDTRYKLQALESRAVEIANQLKPFSFEQFEKKLMLNTGDAGNIFNQFEVLIDKYKSSGRIGSYDSCKTAFKSIKHFAGYLKGKEVSKISFAEITPAWLEKYEKYMLNIKGRSRTTIGIYLRALRVVFNIAIEEGEIEPELYPFGKKKYQIPATRNIKKALSKEQLKKLFESKPLTPEQEKAKDFWFFSYSCNGMNIKDIALLRNENIEKDKIIFYRAKTMHTSKTDSKPIHAYLTDFSKTVIKKYRSKSKDSKALVFDIFSDQNNEVIKHMRVKNFTRFINQNLKKLAGANGLPSEISTYWARHSFATNAIRNGASMEFVSEALNHNSMKTTQGYFAGFEENNKKEIMEGLMNF